MTSEEFLKLYNDYDGEPESSAENNTAVVDDGDWTDEGKYSYKETVYAVEDQFFCICSSRSGSYFSDYYYDDPTCVEVVPQTITEVIYVAKKS